MENSSTGNANDEQKELVRRSVAVKQREGRQKARHTMVKEIKRSLIEWLHESVVELEPAEKASDIKAMVDSLKTMQNILGIKLLDESEEEEPVDTTTAMEGLTKPPCQEIADETADTSTTAPS